MPRYEVAPRIQEGDRVTINPEYSEGLGMTRALTRAVQSDEVVMIATRVGGDALVRFFFHGAEFGHGDDRWFISTDHLTRVDW